MKKNILIIGFMGVGKGTVAREFVKHCNMFSIDTDDLIESQEGITIKKIFEKHGEEYFRNLEQKCADWIEHNVRNTLISTGGGFFKRPNIKKLGTIVYLESSFDAIMDRILGASNSAKKLNKRPLLKDAQKAKALFDERMPQYQKIANVVINVENKKPKEIVTEILEKVKQYEDNKHK